MKHLLSKSGLADLRRFASSNVLIGLDFDGTLAAIVSDPNRAALTAAMRDSVARLNLRYPCVVISGRARSDLRARVAGLGFRAVIGNHGSEPSPGGKLRRELVRGWKAVLAARLKPLSGVVIEDKGLSLSVHYRNSRRREDAHRAILAAAGGFDGARMIEGKRIVNVVPRSAPDKGAALQQQCKRLQCASAIYVGDDDTDEDVFKMRDVEKLLSVRVGLSRSSFATHYVRSQRAVGDLLKKLVAFRATGSATREARAATGSR